MKKSVSYSTRPRALRGALSRSTIALFSNAAGSSSPLAHTPDAQIGAGRPKRLALGKGLDCIHLDFDIGHRRLLGT